METPNPQPEDKTPASSAVTTALEPVPEPTFSPTTQSWEKGRWIVTQIFAFLAQLLNGLGSLFITYRQAIITVLLILGALVALRVVGAVMGALNDIPLLAPTFKLVGIGYSVWFVNRYLLKSSTRQELSQAIQNFLGNISA